MTGSRALRRIFYGRRETQGPFSLLEFGGERTVCLRGISSSLRGYYEAVASRRMRDQITSYRRKEFL
jgi:hypothetical protein